MDEITCRFLVLAVRVDPRAVLLGLTHCLEHVGLDPVRQLGQRRHAHGLERPHAEQGLIQQILVVAARCATLGQLAAFAAVELAPALQRLVPCGRHLGEHADAGAHVFRALAVMGGAGQQRMGPAARPLLILAVECRQRDAEAMRIGPHFVEGDQPVVLIEGRVLDCLRHHRAAVLLEFHGERADRLAVGLALALPVPRQQYLAHEVEDAGIHCLAALLRHADRPVHVAHVVRCGLAAGHIGAVDGEAGHNVRQRCTQGIQREIAGAAVALGNPG